MADPPEATTTQPPEPASPPARRSRKRPPAADDTTPSKPADAKPTEKKASGPKVPKRAELAPPLRALLAVRRTLDRRRPIFGRQAANRYYRIGRDGAWRRPRGLQSKQRRHYGYRAEIVSIGYRSPARVRGLVPSGFAPIVVHTAKELGAIDARTQAAIIARTVGTRRRLVLEEEARKLGIRVLNPIVTAETEA